jgi:phasin family protein
MTVKAKTPRAGNAEAPPAEAPPAEPAPAAAAAPASSPSPSPGFSSPQKEFPMKEQMDKVMKATEELVSFSQGNLEALIKSNQILVQGLQDLSRQTLAAAQAQFEEAVAVFKALPSVKSVKEAFDLQASLTRSAFEKSVAETSRLTDASFKLAEQVTAPLVARLTAAVDKFGKFTA